MTADLLAAWRAHGFTVYGEVGRKPRDRPGQRRDLLVRALGRLRVTPRASGFRVGRFIPAYGIRLADHTAYTRGLLGFDKYDQVYALELSHTGQRHLLQVSVGPGNADAIVHGEAHAFTATGRFQWDSRPADGAGLLRPLPRQDDARAHERGERPRVSASRPRGGSASGPRPTRSSSRDAPERRPTRCSTRRGSRSSAGSG